MELLQHTLKSSPPHSMQTLEAKANTGNADSGCLRKLSQGGPEGASEQLFTTATSLPRLHG